MPCYLNRHRCTLALNALTLGPACQPDVGEAQAGLSGLTTRAARRLERADVAVSGRTHAAIPRRVVDQRKGVFGWTRDHQDEAKGSRGKPSCASGGSGHSPTQRYSQR
jgi:hypothetical protein